MRTCTYVFIHACRIHMYTYGLDDGDNSSFLRRWLRDTLRLAVSVKIIWTSSSFAIYGRLWFLFDLCLNRWTREITRLHRYLNMQWLEIETTQITNPARPKNWREIMEWKSRETEDKSLRNNFNPFGDSQTFVGSSMVLQMVGSLR